MPGTSIRLSAAHSNPSPNPQCPASRRLRSPDLFGLRAAHEAYPDTCLERLPGATEAAEPFRDREVFGSRRPCERHGPPRPDTVSAEF